MHAQQTKTKKVTLCCGPPTLALAGGRRPRRSRRSCPGWGRPISKLRQLSRRASPGGFLPLRGRGRGRHGPGLTQLLLPGVSFHVAHSIFNPQNCFSLFSCTARGRRRPRSSAFLLGRSALILRAGDEVKEPGVDQYIHKLSVGLPCSASFRWDRRHYVRTTVTGTGTQFTASRLQGTKDV